MRWTRAAVLAGALGTGCVPLRRAVPADPIAACVLEQGRLVEVPAQLVGATGDTLVRGKPIAEVYPQGGEYAASHAWYREHEPIDYHNVCYVQYGGPRVVAAERLRRIGEWRGVPAFVEADDHHRRPQVMYLAVSRGCVFQAHQYMTSEPPVSCPQPFRFQQP